MITSKIEREIERESRLALLRKMQCRINQNRERRGPGKMVGAQLQVITARVIRTISNEYQRQKIDRVAHHLKYQHTYVSTSQHSLISTLDGLLQSPWK